MRFVCKIKMLIWLYSCVVYYVLCIFTVSYLRNMWPTWKQVRINFRITFFCFGKSFEVHYLSHCIIVTAHKTG